MKNNIILEVEQDGIFSCCYRFLVALCQCFTSTCFKKREDVRRNSSSPSLGMLQNVDVVLRNGWQRRCVFPARKSLISPLEVQATFITIFYNTDKNPTKSQIFSNLKCWWGVEYECRSVGWRESKDKCSPMFANVSCGISSVPISTAIGGTSLFVFIFPTIVHPRLLHNRSNSFVVFPPVSFVQLGSLGICWWCWIGITK